CHGSLAAYEEKAYHIFIMIDGALIDSFNLQARQFAVRWKEQIRKASQLKHYNALDDEALIENDMVFYPLLARTLSRGLDRSLLGGFFVDLGKKRMGDGFPISEVIYAVNLAQKVVIEYIMTEYAPENTLRMYQSMGIMMEISEFFLLGCFYLTKGFLEATYTHMNSDDRVSKELLNKYFRDDFFFKQN
ncbi:MAG: hypothetical protein LBU00_02045, partial [Treponema sp.]|nr:hypothetical protein [Treponema sp.]